MSIICTLFGHTPRKGWGGGAQYGTVWGGNCDGVGREHLFMRFDCKRCSDKIYLNIHVPTEFKRHNGQS